MIYYPLNLIPYIFVLTIIIIVLNILFIIMLYISYRKINQLLQDIEGSLRNINDNIEGLATRISRKKNDQPINPRKLKKPVDWEY